jgi:hypothetical protein
MFIVGTTGAEMAWSVSGDAGIEIQPSAAGTAISFVALTGPTPFDGQADIGLLIHGARCIFSNMYVSNWGGIGISVNADINLGTNANECSFTKVQLVLCGNSLAHQTGSNAGMYFNGGDSNGCTMIGCDATDSRRGFYDSSFLGNTFLGCSVEGCNDRFTKNPNDPTVGYGFITDDGNARSQFFGCYMEGDSQGDIILPSMVFGGIVSNRGNATTFTSGAVTPTLALSRSYVNPIDGVPTEAAVALGAIGSEAGLVESVSVINTSTGIPIQEPMKLYWGKHAWTPDWWTWTYAGLDIGDFMRMKKAQLWFPGDLYLGYLAGTNYGMRQVIGGANPSVVPDSAQNGEPWRVGDTWIVATPAPGAPSSYRCTSVDNLGVPTWKVDRRVDP